MSVSFVGYLLMELWKSWEANSELTRAVAREAACSLSETQLMQNDAVKDVFEQFVKLLNAADCVRFDQTSSARVSLAMRQVLEEAAEVRLDDRQMIEWLVEWLGNINDSLYIRVFTTVILGYSQRYESTICTCFGSVLFHHYLAAMKMGKNREAANWLKLVKKELARSADQTKEEKDTVHCCYQPGYSGYSVPNDDSDTPDDDRNKD